MANIPEVGSSEWYDWIATILISFIFTFTVPVLILIDKIKEYRARKNKKAR
jgi:hypothetical protein